MTNTTTRERTPDRHEQIQALARSAKTDPNQRQRLADAVVIQALVEGAKLDPLVAAIGARIDELGREAIEELDRAIKAYTGDAPPEPEDGRAADPGTLPTVSVQYQRCPACGHAAADRTFKLGKESRRPVPGSPDCRFTYATCTKCGLKVRAVFYSEA